MGQQNDVTWFEGFVGRADRERLHGHKGAVIWFTGLSASGKSTIAHHLEKRLHEMGASTYVFDGDNVRHGLCSDLGFTEENRRENIRRIGEMVKLFVDAGILAITAFISPYRADRENVRRLVEPGRFFEIFVNCPLDVCAERDPKGIYRKARQGAIAHFTGVSAPYEPPEDPDLVIFSHLESPELAAARVVTLLEAAGVISNPVA